MGRAIVRDPKCFLMDEPLSNLDAKLRVQMRTQVARLQRQLGTTMVYVTHDQTEAMTLGDRVAVMRAGIIQQVDTPKRLYEDPANLFVAGFIGSPSMNFVAGRLEGNERQAAVRRGARSATGWSRRCGPAGGHKSRDVIVGMRPEHFEDAASIEDPDAPHLLRFKAKIDVVESMGSELYAYFSVQAERASSPSSSRISPRTSGMEDLPSRATGSRSSRAWIAASKAAPDAHDRARARHERDQALRSRRRAAR